MRRFKQVLVFIDNAKEPAMFISLAVMFIAAYIFFLYLSLWATLGITAVTLVIVSGQILYYEWQSIIRWAKRDE